ncbi:MAG: reductive dehalogenase [Deltaproteobacteria bacterium]|nr:reductive dehalogenase [Deltaproteobacteria bacterium]
MLFAAIVAVNGVFLVGALYFFRESLREKERRASRMAGLGAIVLLLLGAGIIGLPVLRIPVAVLFGMILFFGLVLAFPAASDPRALNGAPGHIRGEGRRHDERDVVFARQRSLPAGSDAYRRYYDMHPEREAPDSRRREKGLLGIPGSIDGRHRPNVAMMASAFDMPDMLGPYSVAGPEEDSSPAEIDPAEAARIVKGYTRHLGADLVGICRINPLWVYSHRGEIHYGNWEEWGKEIEDLPPFAVVFATEMDWAHVAAAPHTPSVAESAGNYALGSYISVILARWFARMGYRGVAEHSRNYDLVMPPLAVDAGLGEVGRLGYLIAPRFGARVRLFATLTDMPLVPDRPISMGVDRFCERCRKCAESCPSRSIPLGEKVLHMGAEKWKLNEDTCFEYWGKIGTDCSVCMAVCPFSRPNTPLHRLVRLMVAHSALAQGLLPFVDNVLYGKRWRPKTPPEWLDFSKGEGPG